MPSLVLAQLPMPTSTPPTSSEKTWYQEGAAHFQTGTAFYRASSRTARDLIVLAAAVYRQQQGQLRVLEGMAGCGVRSLRYVLEAGADQVWANDANPEVQPILAKNLHTLVVSGRVKLSQTHARRLLLDCHLRQDYYDLVDLDCFGNPASYLQAVLGAVRVGGLIYLTSTDGKTSAGQSPSASVRLLGGESRSHPAVHEQGLRFLIGGLAQQAGMLGWTIQPVLSWFQGEVYRVLVRLVTTPWQPEYSGFLGYCHQCGQFYAVGWRQLNQLRCLDHDIPQPIVLSGPLWLGALHDREFLLPMQSLAGEQNWQQLEPTLQLLQAELPTPPYFYTLREIGGRGKLDLPNREQLILKLQGLGYEASRTHINPQAIKTTAELKTCIQLARELSGLKT